MSPNRPDVTLWVFNHPLRYVTEQAEFFCSVMRENGYRVRISNRPSPSGLNVLIENFQTATTAPVAEFCRTFRKRVAVILTEHLDFIGQQILFHGVRLYSRNDYMPSLVKMERLASLMILREHIRCFFRLGDMPKLVNLEQMISGIPVRTLPFPAIVPADRDAPDHRGGPDFDLVFTGQMTDHRRQMLDRLRKDFTVLTGRDIVSRRRRDAMNARARLVLNLPQNRGWQWLSTMRVLAALRCRRATLAIGNFHASSVTPACWCLREEELETGSVRQAVDQQEREFAARLDTYNAMARSDINPRFPHADFELWAELEL